MYLTLILLPLLGSIITGFGGRKLGVKGSQLLSCIFVIISTLITYVLFFEVGLSSIPIYIQLFNWINSESLNINWGFSFDSLTVSMLVPVLTISSLVHIYSISYMSNDPHNQRFFSYLSLFTFMMIILVTADNFLVMFLGWEGVGICSYLLVNFWYTRIPANQSSISALLTNRVGDCLLTIGIISILWSFGNIDYSSVFSISPYINENIIFLVGLCLLIGAMAKSSQIGLHVWLPMAMEGPTPVSALIHAATMVTAGVYLLVRISPIIEYCSTILIACLWIGSITTIFSSLIGSLQQDIKKVIAYSTMSQLGMMVIAIGLSSYNIAIFHLVNHAFYKGLLFLGAGSVIHAVYDNQDFRKYGGLKSFLPLTYTVMLIASLSLVAFPFMAGFYSKDIILESIHGQFFLQSNIVYIITVIGAMFTTLYSVKVLYSTFLTSPNGALTNYKGANEGDIFMCIPLIILAVFSIFFGYISKDIFIGLGSSFFSDNSLFIHPSHEIMINTEFATSSYIKLLPFILTIVISIISILLTEFNINSIIKFKYSNLGYNLFSFLNQRFNLEFLYNKYITNNILNLGGQTVKILDKGSIETIGPFGLERGLINLGKDLSLLDTGNITSYVLYLLIGLSFMVVLFLNFCDIFCLIILIIIIYLCFKQRIVVGSKFLFTFRLKNLKFFNGIKFGRRINLRDHNYIFSNFKYAKNLIYLALNVYNLDYQLITYVLTYIISLSIWFVYWFVIKPIKNSFLFYFQFIYSFVIKPFKDYVLLLKRLNYLKLNNVNLRFKSFSIIDKNIKRSLLFPKLPDLPKITYKNIWLNTKGSLLVNKEFFNFWVKHNIYDKAGNLTLKHELVNNLINNTYQIESNVTGYAEYITSNFNFFITWVCYNKKNFISILTDIIVNLYLTLITLVTLLIGLIISCYCEENILDQRDFSDTFLGEYTNHWDFPDTLLDDYTNHRDFPDTLLDDYFVRMDAPSGGGGGGGPYYGGNGPDSGGSGGPGGPGPSDQGRLHVSGGANSREDRLTDTNVTRDPVRMGMEVANRNSPFDFNNSSHSNNQVGFRGQITNSESHNEALARITRINSHQESHQITRFEDAGSTERAVSALRLEAQGVESDISYYIDRNLPLHYEWDTYERSFINNLFGYEFYPSPEALLDYELLRITGAQSVTSAQDMEPYQWDITENIPEITDMDEFFVPQNIQQDTPRDSQGNLPWDEQYNPQGDLQDNPQVDLQDNPQVDLQDNPQVDLQDNPQVDLQDNPQGDLQDNPGENYPEGNVVLPELTSKEIIRSVQALDIRVDLGPLEEYLVGPKTRFLSGGNIEISPLHYIRANIDLLLVKSLEAKDLGLKININLHKPSSYLIIDVGTENLWASFYSRADMTKIKPISSSFHCEEATIRELFTYINILDKKLGYKGLMPKHIETNEEANRILKEVYGYVPPSFNHLYAHTPF